MSLEMDKRNSNIIYYSGSSAENTVLLCSALHIKHLMIHIIQEKLGNLPPILTGNERKNAEA